MGLFNKPSRNPAPAAAPEPEKKPEATPLTREDVETMVKGAVSETAGQLTGVIGQLREGIEVLASRGPQQVVVQQQQHTAPLITDEQIDAAIANGESPAKLVRQLVDSQARDIRTGLDARIAQLEEFGTNAIGGLQMERLKDRPYYKRFQKEIDQKLGALPAAYRANPDTINLIYQSVVGEHAGELEREAHESALRKAAEGDVPVNEIDVSRGGGSKPGGSGSNRSSTPSIPTVEEFAGKEGVFALQHKERGKDGDSYAQTMGYKDWAHMISQYETLKAEQGDI